MDENEMGEWQPPNEAELKVIEARRERNNQISRLMGEYMLKGYRMLDRLCAECSTILLQDRNSCDYCVACSELHSETSKDDPAISAEAAAASVLEQHQRQRGNSAQERPSYGNANSPPFIVSDQGTEEPDIPNIESTLHIASESNAPVSKSKSLNFHAEGADLWTSYMRVKTKIDALTTQLTKCDNASEITTICTAIKACSDSAIAIKKLI